MTEDQRMKLTYLMNRHSHFMLGTQMDQNQLFETWNLRIGVDDKWLNDLYDRSVEAAKPSH